MAGGDTLRKAECHEQPRDYSSHDRGTFAQSKRRCSGGVDDLRGGLYRVERDEPYVHRLDGQACREGSSRHPLHEVFVLHCGGGRCFNHFEPTAAICTVTWFISY